MPNRRVARRQLLPPSRQKLVLICSSGMLIFHADQSEQVRHILDEDTDMSDWIGSDQALIHIRFPGQALDVRIVTDIHKTLSAFVIAIPEMLHDPENEEDFAMLGHVSLARFCQDFGIAGEQKV